MAALTTMCPRVLILPCRLHTQRTMFLGVLLLAVAGLVLALHKLHFSSRSSLASATAHTPHPLQHSPIPISAMVRGEDGTVNVSGVPPKLGSSTSSTLHRLSPQPRQRSKRARKRSKPETEKTPHPATQRTNMTVRGTVDVSLTQQKVLCFKFSCRLGNQLFQYASVLGLAHRLHRIPVYFPNNILRAALQHPPPAASVEHLRRCKTAKILKEKSCCRFDKAFLEMDPKKDYQLRTYLQSWKYFEGMEARVREAVVFKDSVRQQATRTIKELREKCNQTLIGMHIRREDYLKPGNIQKGYRTPPPDYYQKAMNYMRQRFGKVTFLVAVENGTWFQESVSSARDIIILERHQPAIDMALLASLDHVIISTGTYSWWVGYLNKGVTVYWKDFIAHGTHIGDSFDRNGTTYIYPGWIPF